MTPARTTYAGVFPIAPTPFTDGFDLDLDGQRRVLDCMIDQGVDGICILANYSEQFLLTDAELACSSNYAFRMWRARTGHRDLQPFQHALAAGRARAAVAAGAAMLMLMPPYHGAHCEAEKSTLEHFAR
jgi:4-hydroxy-tetrahydrodipicolinate synthase